MKIIVNDKMQQGYSYELSEPEGKNFAPDFRPELSPQQILEYGAFEGKYITDCRKEFPADWFENARLSPARADAEKNCFGVKSRLSLQEWQRRGWIIEPDRAGGFNGIAGIITGGGCRKSTTGRFAGGRLLTATAPKLNTTVCTETWPVVPDNGKPCCNGLIIRLFER